MHGIARVPDNALVDGSDLDTVRMQTLPSDRGTGLYLELDGYDGPWVNQMYDRPGLIVACLDVVQYQCLPTGFTYMAMRITGKRFGDRPASEGQPMEIYKITVTEPHIEWECVRV